MFIKLNNLVIFNLTQINHPRAPNVKSKYQSGTAHRNMIVTDKLRL